MPRQLSANSKRDKKGVLGTIQRASSDSKQPRFSAKAAGEFFISIMNWTHSALENEPPYIENSMVRDQWLSEVCWKEPHLAGVINGVVSIDKNRGWTLVGGRNQVNRYQEILHGFEAAPNLAGWRPGTSVSALSYYTTDLGLILEMGREGKNGPMRKMYYTDSTRCNLTGNVKFPLQYDPYKGKKQDWRPLDFLRVVSMPDIREQYNGLGHCAVSRCIELTKVMVAVYEHNREQLGSKAPKGLLMLDGISETSWDDAMEIRDAKLEGLEQEYFAGVAVLAGSGDTSVDAKLIALSQLPKDFDLQAFTSMLMYGYALCFGYDPSEFYPVQFGSLGRGTEMQVQHEKATAKGQMDYAFGFQEQVQLELPPALEFTFDERDDAGELAQAQVRKAQAEIVSTMRLTGPGDLSTEEVRQLWAEAGLIPREWTEIEEDVEATDTGEEDAIESEDKDKVTDEEAQEAAETIQEQKDRLLDNPYIRRAAEDFRSEPIVEYSWPKDRTRILAESGTWLLSPERRYYTLNREVLYESEDDDVEITDEDIEIAIEVGAERLGEEFESLLLGEEAPTSSASRAINKFLRLFRQDTEYWYWDADAYRYVDSTGALFPAKSMQTMVNSSLEMSSNYTSDITQRLASGDLTRSQFTELLRAELKGEYIRQYMLGRGGYEQMTFKDWGSIGGSLAEQYRYIDGFIDTILEGKLSEKQLSARAKMYANSAREANARARNVTMKDWGVDEEFWYTTSGNSCVDCLDYEAMGYQELGYFPFPCDGTTVCLTNCKCGKTGRNSKTGEEYEG